MGKEGGFTLIEALLAMSVFAIGAAMLFPAIFAWVDATSLSLQRDEAMRVLTRSEDTLTYSTGSVWDPQATESQYETALETLDSASYSTWKEFAAADLPTKYEVQTAVVGVTDTDGNVASRVMRIRVRWDRPGGGTESASRLLQRNGELL
ncbi:MAG: type II secretion system protein [Thiohalorhabdus sp.]|uniref:type II secretion system protein n=1 Tax=Thiohalorhabdus sp. TaxID=3094134 RepID=UPI003980D0BB